MRESIAALFDWFSSRDRDVPGRGETDPYRIWVAEVMAQQTRISTVVPYYEAFLDRFPDVHALADASLDEVLKVWEGLGYYGRARNLHRAAGEITERFRGHLPDHPDDLRSLPGIGPYTAGAIASIGFGHPEPAVDGNVRRVLSRLHDLEKPTAGQLDQLARDLIEHSGGSAGLLNQALMDLGSAVCTPRSPGCGECPLASACVARGRGTVALRPAPHRSAPLPHHDIAAAIVWKEGRVLIARRPPEGLLGGLWEFPGGKVESGESPAGAARREVKEELEIDVQIVEAADTVDHAYSHFRITLHLFHARWLAGELPAADDGSPAWVLPEELVAYAFPTANHAIIRRLHRGEVTGPRTARGPALP